MPKHLPGQSSHGVGKKTVISPAKKKSVSASGSSNPSGMTIDGSGGSKGGTITSTVGR